MELTKERLTIIIASAIAIVLVGIYAFLYRPLISQCIQAGRECKGIETEVSEAHTAIELLKIELLKQVATKRTLISEKDISLAIDEFTKQGRSGGINFTSIVPREIKAEAGSMYKVLPIDMEMESTYKELAVFLGSLEQLEKSLVTVKDLNMTSDKGKREKLDTRLTVNMYLSGR